MHISLRVKYENHIKLIQSKLFLKNSIQIIHIVVIFHFVENCDRPQIYHQTLTIISIILNNSQIHYTCQIDQCR